ncbi:hypothetical protein K439DRAFT_263579 [Ramaria rubella]|nr:hypothetical protein K439DRAFT_263579 [Ramaria rubella]
MLPIRSPMRYPLNASPRQGQQNNSRGRSPRFGTPSIRRASGSERSESPGQFMDVDSVKFSMDRWRPYEESRGFALSETLSVRLAASLPIEVQQAFQTADPTREVFAGSVHVLHGPTCYAIVVSVQTCFVWKIDLNSPFHSPTCYIFPVPPPDPSSPYLTLPYASLLSFGAPREPGLLLIASSGETRFWDSIGTGLAGAERFNTSRIDLGENEAVTGVEHVDAMVYIVRTKTRLYRLTVTARPGTGKFVVVSTPFTDRDNQSTSWLSPFRILQRRNGTWGSGDITTVFSPTDCRVSAKTTVATRKSEERPIWVLTAQNLMKWNVNLGGGEQCVHNSEIRELVTNTILHGTEADANSLDVELLDVAVDTVGDPVLLISHGPLTDQGPSPLDVDTGPERAYALIRLYLPPSSDTFKVKGEIEVLPYELAIDPRRASSPRLTVLQGSGQDGSLELTFTQFSDAFAFTALEPPYQEQLHLKNINDLVLGSNVLEQADGREVLLLTTGMILVARPNVSNIVKMKDDVHIGKANVLKSTIRQAMKYGIKPENPLRFQLPSLADGESLKTAAEQMSHAFLVSDPDVVAPTLSMGTQLASRESSLEALVTFIGESGGLGKISHSTREHLLADAEKLAAAHRIWAYHNEQAQKSPFLNLLPLTIETYMRRVGKFTDGDAMRTFFHSQVPSIGALVPELVDAIKSESPSSDVSDPDLFVQANGLVLALFTAAFQHRSHNRAKYQLDRAFVQPWTSEPILLLNLRHLFETTVTLRMQLTSSKDGSSGIEKHSYQDNLTFQLRELASCLFRAYNDRLEFLNNHSQDGGGNERERNRLDEEFRSLRPVVLDHLVRVDGTDYAFKLAETYRDFHALGELSYRATANKVLPTSDRIRGYISKFQEEFTSQLYKWYIEQGKLKLLFDQENEYGDYINTFFSQDPKPRLSWIHDIGKPNYQGAASALLTEAEAESNRETRHLMLSIGKLASMAEGPSATPQDKMKAFNNALDFMAIHDTLLEQFSDELGNPPNFSIESRVRAISSVKCAVPSDRPALQDLFQRILRQLLQGNALTEEEAVDLLSMKDNSARPTDFVDALIILSNSMVGVRYTH